MKTFDIKGVERKDLGKKSTRELRNDGLVPCVLYGGEVNIHFSVVNKDLKNLVYTPHVYSINIDINGKAHQALIREIQFHPVSDEIVHIDFLKVSNDKKVVISIPVKLEGSSEGVKQGGKLMLKLRKLKVRGLAKNFPDSLNIDISSLMLGKSIKVGELKFDNLELLDPKNSVVTTVKLTRSAMSKQAETTTK